MSVAKRLFICVSGLVAVSVALAACGGGGSSSSSSSSSSTESGSTSETQEEASGSSGVATAEAAVAKLEEEPSEEEFPKPPNTPYDPGSHKVAIVACSTAGAGCNGIGEGIHEAALAAGWKPSAVLDGKFDPSVQSGLIQKAVQEGYEAIVIVAFSPATVEAAVNAAAKEGIPISCVTCIPEPAFEGKVSFVTNGGLAGGEAVGDYIVANGGSEGKIIQFVDHTFQVLADTAEGTEKVVSKLCPECELENIEISTAELAKPGPPFFTAALAANPPGTVNWVTAQSDTYAIPMLPTAQSQGREELKIAGTEGNQVFLEALKAGQNAAVSVNTQYSYQAWAGFEEVARLVAGQKEWDATEVPISLITKNNVDEYLAVAPKFLDPPNFDYQTYFKELWQSGAE